MEVVKFFDWAQDRILQGNLTIEGWKNGSGYLCEQDRNHEIKTFKEYYDFHDLEAIPGSKIDAQSIFSEVELEMLRKDL